MTPVSFSDILGFGTGFGGCGLVNITAIDMVRIEENGKTRIQNRPERKLALDAYVLGWTLQMCTQVSFFSYGVSENYHVVRINHKNGLQLYVFCALIRSYACPAGITLPSR